MGQIAVFRAKRKMSPRASQSPVSRVHARSSGSTVFWRDILVLQAIYHDGVTIRELGWSSSTIPLEVFAIAGVCYKNLSVRHRGRHETGEQAQAVRRIDLVIASLTAP